GEPSGAGGLTEADTAVVRRDVTVPQHAEAVGLESLDTALHEERVLENAARQRDGAESGALASLATAGHDRVDDAVVESRGDRGRGVTGAEVFGGSAYQIGAADVEEVAAIDQRRRIGPRLSRVGELLELDGRLPLVTDVVTDAEQCGARIEKSSGARGQWRERRCPRHREHGRPLAFVTAHHVERRRGAVGRFSEIDRRHPPWRFDRGDAAGHRDRTERSAALEAAEIRADEITAP